WTFQNNQFVQLLPGVAIPIVNAEWHSTFPSGIPANTPLMGRCRPLESPSSPAPAAVTPPPASTTAVAAPLPAPVRTAALSTYAVEEGDSLSSIAERFHRPDVSIGTFLDALYAANGLTAESLLRVGQVLRLPG
ncbi:MAG: LysM domain-containing protein, partial [Dehalococcoidia bacterium]